MCSACARAAIGNIGGDHATPPQRFRNIDLQNFCMRNLAAQKRRVQHSRQFDVIDEQRPAGEQTTILVAFDRLSEGAGGHGLAPHPLGRRDHGIDDVLVSGAAAQISRKRLPHFLLAG